MSNTNIRVEKKTQVRNGVMRAAFVAAVILIQFVWIVFLYFRLASYSTQASFITATIALITALWIYGRETNQAYRTPWIILILGFPIVGISLFIVMGRRNSTKRMRQRYEDINTELRPFYKQDKAVFEKMERENLSVANQAHLIHTTSHYPVYHQTKTTYYKEAEEGLEAQLHALSLAKEFIFMEYHAIEDKESFAQIHAILKQKVKEGVEVRILYDDVGSIGFINTDFIDRMKADGIDCRVFNPIRPVLMVFMNNRDHRKIMVIDGKVGFTGGYNLANEYFNITHPYGYWKDTGVRLEGDAVNSLTLIFFENWMASQKEKEDVQPYLVDYTCPGQGYVQPYADAPLDEEYLGEDVYMGILNNATEYAYIVTPYLILTDEMIRTMTLASKRGVDVRIITPGIPDKKLTYMITRSYYHSLAQEGVRIFEYTPGFCHCKMSLSDDCVATCGTINLDYRSLYLHFENGVFFYQGDHIVQMKEDFEDMFSKSKEVTQDYVDDLSVLKRTLRAILRMFAPFF